jgi:hypothetical protein
MFLFSLAARDLGIVSQHRFGHPVCGYVRYWTWFHSLVLGHGTVQPRSSRHGHVHRRHRQLDGQLHRWLGLPANSSKTSRRFSSAFRILNLLLHQQEALGDHGPLVFIFFAAFLAFFVAFTYKKVPETKNKTIEEISAMFRQRSYQ